MNKPLMILHFYWFISFKSDEVKQFFLTVKCVHQNGNLEENDASYVNTAWSFHSIRECFIYVTDLEWKITVLDSSVKFKLFLVIRACTSESSWPLCGWKTNLMLQVS